MLVKVLITDLQTKIIYQASVETPICQGKDVYAYLMDTNHPVGFCIPQVRGWVRSDSQRIMYLIDACGKRFKMQSIV